MAVCYNRDAAVETRLCLYGHGVPELALQQVSSGELANVVFSCAPVGCFRLQSATAWSRRPCKLCKSLKVHLASNIGQSAWMQGSLILHRPCSALQP